MHINISLCIDTLHNIIRKCGELYGLNAENKELLNLISLNFLN